MIRFVAMLSMAIIYYKFTNSLTLPGQKFTLLTLSRVAKDLHEDNSTTVINQKTSLLEIEENRRNNTETSYSYVKARVKRQQSSGAGKFTEAARVPQLKLLRLFLTMFKNLWASSHTGGSHLFHPYVPKPIVQLFKQRIVEFFFPDIGEEAMKKD